MFYKNNVTSFTFTTFKKYMPNIYIYMFVCIYILLIQVTRLDTSSILEYIIQTVTDVLLYFKHYETHLASTQHCCNLWLLRQHSHQARPLLRSGLTLSYSRSAVKRTPKHYTLYYIYSYRCFVPLGIIEKFFFFHTHIELRCSK